MSTRQTMTHRALVTRDANRGDAEDPWGDDDAPQWDTHIAGLPCHFWFESVRSVVDGSKSVEVETRKMVVPLGTNVTEDDRVERVTDRRGFELAPGTMRIDSVGRRADHLVLTMVQVA